MIGVFFTSMTVFYTIDAEATIPPIHDSEPPYQSEFNNWVLIGWDRYIEENPDFQGRAFIALYCKAVGNDNYIFKWTWEHSNGIQVPVDDDYHWPDSYWFQGFIYYDNGPNINPTEIWYTNQIEQSTSDIGETTESDEIQITSWANVRFWGNLFTNTEIKPGFREYLIAGLLMYGVGVYGSAVVTAFGIAALPLSLAAFLIGSYVAYKLTQPDDHIHYYFEIYGGLDLLDKPSACVWMEIISHDGWDLPESLEDPPVNRRYKDTFLVTVSSVFTCKISLDFYMLFKENYEESYNKHALTKISLGFHGAEITINGFPRGKVSVPAIDPRTLSAEWDVTNEYNDINRGFSSDDVKKYLDSGHFLPLDPEYDDISKECSYWDLPTVSFNIYITVDYELPESFDSQYPTSPIGSVYQDQAACGAIDFYTLGHLTDPVELDVQSEYDVKLGDGSFPMAVMLPLIPIIIGYQALREHGIFIELPGDFQDVFIMPPSYYDIIGRDYFQIGDPDNDYIITNPEDWGDGISDLIDDTQAKRNALVCIRVPDPVNTIYIQPHPAIIPESLDKDPDDFAIDGSGERLVRNNYIAWEELITSNEEFYSGIAQEEIERRKATTVRIEPGVCDPDILTIAINDLSSRFKFSIQFPDDTIKDLMIINPPNQNELASISIRNLPAFILIPGTDEIQSVTDGMIVNLPNENDATLINIEKPSVINHYLSLLTLPKPEKHTIISIGSLDDEYSNWVSISIGEETISQPVRTFQECVPDYQTGTFTLGNFINVDDGETTVKSYTSTDPLPIGISSCDLTITPSTILTDPPDTSGLFSSSNSGLPSYFIAFDSGFTELVFNLEIAHDELNDDEMGFIISEEGNRYDGILIRGTTESPSPHDYHGMNSWMISTTLGVAYVDTINNHVVGWNRVHTSHIVEPEAPFGDYQILIHHPGPDGLFYTTGSENSDSQYLIQPNGAESFISSARATTDDLFFLKDTVLTNLVTSIDETVETSNELTVVGTFSRMDGNLITASLDDGANNKASNSSYSMFSKYSIVIDISSLPGGIYSLIVADVDGNSIQTSIEVFTGAPG